MKLAHHLHGEPISYFIGRQIILFASMTKCVIKTQTQNAATAQAINISVSQKRKQYCLYNNEAFLKSSLTFFLKNENEPLYAFCKKENMNQSTFCHFL